MLFRSQSETQRRAAAVVETAAVMIVFLILLFGVLEYCRFFFMRELISNAAREGARYAVVHTYDGAVETSTRGQVLHRMQGLDGKVKNFTIQIYHADTNGNRITTYDASATSNYAYFSDAGGSYLMDNNNSKIYTSKDSSGSYVLDGGGQKVYLNLDSNSSTVTGVNPSAFSAYTSSKKIQNVDSIGNAKFGEYIGVEISCDYDPITPAILRLGNTIKIRSKVLMYSEAN